MGRAHLRHVRQPVQDRENPFEVITDSAVGHSIVVHDLDAPELVIRGVYFPPEDLETEAREKTFIFNRNKGKVCFVILTKMVPFFLPASVGCSEGPPGPSS